MKRQLVAPRARFLRRDHGEAAATVAIGAGIAMLVQPFSLAIRQCECGKDSGSVPGVSPRALVPGADAPGY